jgi:predicted nucleic acid-binding protein
MNITIDTSALLAVCTNEPHKAQLVQLTVGARLIAPFSVHWEVGNALSAMIKRERISLAGAQACLGAYQQIPMKFVDVDLGVALQHSSRFKMYAYDAYLITCALENATPLLTLDKGLKSIAAQLGVQVLGEIS